MLLVTYYAFNYASIIGLGLTPMNDSLKEGAFNLTVLNGLIFDRAYRS